MNEDQYEWSSKEEKTKEENMLEIDAGICLKKTNEKLKHM